MEKEIIYRHNVMKIGSLEAFLRIKGGFNGGRRDVYFVRALGCGFGMEEQILAIDKQMKTEMQRNRLFYTRIRLPSPLIRQEDIYFYSSQFARLETEQKLSVRHQDQTRQFERVLGLACTETIKKYRLVKNNMTESIEKNFVIKLLYWTDCVLGNALADWDGRRCFKILVEDVQKEQEYLFCYMLTLLGCDVLLLECQKDISTIDALKTLSEEFRQGEFKESMWLPRYDPCEPAPAVREENKEALTDPGRDTERKEIQPPRQQIVVSGDSEKSFEELALLASSIVMIAVYNREGEPIATGSGIMIGRDGYILTNDHVTRGGCFFAVRIEDDEQIYKTNEIIKYNTVLDLAVIRIDRRLDPLPLYQGGKLARGQKVVAIGSPLGMFNSVSDGIISGFRQIDSVDMIQFTAPISHGSSGGALLNMKGEIIGISTAGIDKGQNLNLAVNYKDIGMFVRGFTS